MRRYKDAALGKNCVISEHLLQAFVTLSTMPFGSFNQRTVSTDRD